MILGAGASKPYKFPTGIELYDEIVRNFERSLRGFQENENYHYPDIFHALLEADALTKALSITPLDSVDKFLNINKRFERIGTIAIISALYKFEQYSVRAHRRDGKDGDWYRYLFNKLVDSGDAASILLNFQEEKISFVTFNYDRSFEHFLYESLVGLLSQAGVSHVEIAQVLNRLPVVHVFGKIADLPWQCEGDNEGKMLDEKANLVRFGEEKLPAPYVGLMLHKNIRLMYGERRDSTVLQKARELIASASRVLFMGFGYDRDNLSLLGVPESLKGKQVFGTAYGLVDNEVEHIRKSKLGLGRSNAISQISNCDCLRLLRDRLL
jgi:hypothetical protein